MLVDRKIIFDAVKELRGGKGYTQSEVDLLDHAIDLATGGGTSTVPAPPVLSTFKLSETSLSRLDDVRPELIACVKLAIRYTLVDFGVNQGKRTVAEQRAAVASGNSRTMHSKHLPQADGKVWAVDLVAYVNGKVTWDFNTYGAIACAMDRAATELGYASHIRWGCAWDRVLSDFGGDPVAYIKEAKAYADRHPGSDLLDAPHFEWVP